MFRLMQSLEFKEVQKGINLVGLIISEFELNELKSGKTVSLEDRGLSEIGSLFIIAEALSARNSIKNITFQKLPTIVTESSRHSGIPIHCWNSETLGKCYLLLTLIDGKPAIIVSTEYQRSDSKIEEYDS